MTRGLITFPGYAKNVNLAVITDMEGHIIHFNELSEVFFKAPLEEIVGTNFSNYFEEPSIFRNMLAHSTTYQPYVRHRIGLKDLSDKSTVRVYKDETFCLVVAESLQVTEEVLVAQEEKKWAERLQIMLFGISHELKTPLAVARGYTEALGSKGDPEVALKAMGALDKISEILNNMTEPIRELNDRQNRVDLGRGLEMYCKTLPYTEPTKRYIGELNADFNAATGKQIRMSKARLYQVFTNLFENAIRATHHLDTEARIDIRSYECPKPHHSSCIVIEFEDNGVGMPQDTANKVFTPLYTTRGPDTGTGLGGYFIHQFVMDAGGTIEVKSTEGEGTLFRIHLPHTKT